MYCKNCGNEVLRGKKFCKNCGVAVSEIDHEVSTAAHKIEKSIKSHQSAWIGGGIVGAIIIIAALTSFLSSSAADNAGNGLSQENEAAVVDINCDNGKAGSGTIFSTDGTVLTNNHVIAGATSCEITIPDPSTGQISEIYEATPQIIPKLSKKYDVATLKIDAAHTDSNGKTWGTYPATFTPFAIPSSCDTSQPSKLGDAVRIYGYPVTSGGYNLTVTDGIISSFSDSGYILTSGKVDSGNSGGLAIDQNGCWLGIPSAVESGNYQNLGVIIPGNIVAANFLSDAPAKASPAGLKTIQSATAAETAATPSFDQICQNKYGSYSVSAGSNDNGSPTCGCQSGYSWDFTGNGCASNTSLQSQCQNNYGTGSYSYLQNGQSYCGCSTGYEWNSGQTACVTVPVLTGYQVCSALGANETWDGTYSSDGKFNCVCDSGYFYDSSTDACVSGYTYCENKDGYGATYDSATNSCGCMSGYTLYGGRCVTKLSYCQSVNGYGATYDYGTNSCSCSSGYISSGGQCVSGYTYCQNYGGTFDTYNSLTGKCECMAGYYWTGSYCAYTTY